MLEKQSGGFCLVKSHMKHRVFIAFLILGAVAFPQQASANAGTPLMWAGMLHMVFGNALIGLGEGLLLARLFSVPRNRGVSVMILANYFSAWVGGLFIGNALVPSITMDLNNGWRWFWIMVIATYFMTAILEWPFIVWCLRGSKDSLRRSLRASIVVQSASYVLLFGWYWMASGTSLYTKMNIVAGADMSLPESVLVYFIAPADGNVYSRPLMGGVERKVFDLHSTDEHTTLFIRPSMVDTNRWDLMACMETSNYRYPRIVEVLTNLLVEAARDPRITDADPPDYMGRWAGFGVMPGLAEATDSQWKCYPGYYSVDGLRAWNQATGEQVRFAYETPFGSWAVRKAVHLPTDKVLFQFGNDQICAFDPARRRVALLWHGRGPVPVIQTTISKQTTQAADANRFSLMPDRAPSPAGSHR
jgi:hypothetical protein